jgi:hypothetical protein
VQHVDPRDRVQRHAGYRGSDAPSRGRPPSAHSPSPATVRTSSHGLQRSACTPSPARACRFSDASVRRTSTTLSVPRQRHPGAGSEPAPSGCSPPSASAPPTSLPATLCCTLGTVVPPCCAVEELTNGKSRADRTEKESGCIFFHQDSIDLGCSICRCLKKRGSKEMHSCLIGAQGVSQAAEKPLFLSFGGSRAP